MDEFVNYFMVRKVICSKELKRATGTVIKKLGQWLLKKNYIESEDGEDIIDSGKRAASDLPAADDFLQMLVEYVETASQTLEEVLEDSFEIVDIKPGRLHLSAMSLVNDDIVIAVPQCISESCKKGWFISGSLGQKGKKWHLCEVWNVYP